MLKFELKNVLRDKMNFSMLVYPFLMLAMTVFLFPLIFKMEEMQGQGLEITMILVIVMLLSMGFMITGALLGFALLDNKDEDVLQTIAVTPISKKGYVKFKLVYTYIISVLSCFLMLAGTKLFASAEYALTYGEMTIYLFDSLTYLHILAFSFSSSLLVPAMGLSIVALSKNKIEGFAYMKASGFLILVPMLLVFPTFKGAGQYILSIFPNFWGTQGVLNLMLPNLFDSVASLNFYLYMLIGAVICVIYSILGYKLFLNKTK